MEDIGVDDEVTIKRILRFFRSKRNLTSKEVDHEVADMRISRLQDEVYNVDEVERMLDDLSATLQGSVREHMERTAYMAVLLVRQLFKGGVDEGINLIHAIDLPQLEDHKALSEIKKIDNDDPPAQMRKARKKLKSMADEHRRMLDKISDLEDSNDNLREKYDAKVQQCTSLLLSQKEMKAKFKLMQTALKQLEDALKKERSRAARAAARAVSASERDADNDDTSAAAARAVEASYRGDVEDESKDAINVERAIHRERADGNDRYRGMPAGELSARGKEGKYADDDHAPDVSEGKLGSHKRGAGNHTVLISSSANADDKIAALLLEIERANARIGEADNELEAIRKASKKRIASSKQFQLMRRLLERKNEQIRLLRKRIEKYEPERVSKMADGELSESSDGTESD